MTVVLIGYMGCGKSTIGKRLASILNYRFLDLDAYISDKEKATISNIFKTKGELYFRKKESFYLNTIVNSFENIVFSLGGGTPCYGNNLSILKSKPNIETFYLKLSPQLLTQRLFAERSNRPLLNYVNSEDQLLEFISKHLFERNQYYNKAKHILITDNKSQKTVLEDIIIQLI